MKKRSKRAFSALLLPALLWSVASPALSGVLPVSAAEDGETIQDKVLFSTSFEESDTGNLLESATDASSGVIRTEYGTRGPGLTVDFNTVDGSADYNGSECKFNAFDGKASTKFLTKDTEGYLVFGLYEAAVVTSYDVVSANDEPTRDPKSWVLYGSNDGETWTELDTQQGVSFSSRLQTKTFSFENTASYLYYKFDITECNGSTSYLQFAGIELYAAEDSSDSGTEDGSEDTSVVTVLTDTVTATPEGDAAYGQSSAALFDGLIDEGHKYLIRGSAADVTVQLSAPYALTSYALTSANDAPARDPKDWTLYGSSDGETWTALDSRSDEDFALRGQTNTYSFENSTAYTYYKLSITAQNGTDDWGLTILQLAEWELILSETAEDTDTGCTVVSISADPEGSVSAYGDESSASLIDGLASTKYVIWGSSADITVKLSKAYALTSYALTAANDAPARDPKDWTLYGSDDGEIWTALDSRSDEDFALRGQTNTYSFENSTAYTYYKLSITAQNGTDDWGYTILQLAEWELVLDEDAPLPVTVDTSTVSGSSAAEGSEGSLNLFDGSETTKVCAAGTTFFVSFALTEEAVVTAYSLTSANDWEDRDPKDWTLYGSADGETWVALDSRSGEDFAARYQTNTYTFENATAYLYYKLDVTANSGNAYTQFADLTLFAAPQKSESSESSEPDYTVDLSTVDGSADLGGGESKTNLFDGSVYTKMVVKGDGFWVSFGLSKAELVTAYTLSSANDHATRDPKSWNFYGSDDGETWVKLDEREGETFSERYETKTFVFENDTPYRYYKLEVTEKAGTNDYLQLSEISVKLAEESDAPVEGMASVVDFGPIATDCGLPGAWSGNSCLAVYGAQSRKTDTYARNVLYDNLSIPVTANTRLSYLIFPGLFDIDSYDYEYTSCRVIIDLRFTDGSYLSQLGAKDQYGSALTPAGQVEGECLYTAQWNYVESCIGEVAAGKTIDQILVYFQMDEAEDASRFVTFFDDLVIEDKAEVVYEHLSDYINILRGTNNDYLFSRGLCTPGVTVPGGFNFYSPVTQPTKSNACYNYQQNGDNNPLDSISVMHAPNYWIGSYGTWQFMANTSVDTSAGTDGITSEQISSDARQAKFSHANETANAHYYSVTLNEGTAASGVTIEVTPTSHGAYVRFSFPSDAENVNLIFDSLWGSSADRLTFSEDGKSFTAVTNHNSAGSTKMYVYGEFDQSYASVSVVNGKQGIVSFAKGTTTVTMKIATSFLSAAQAEHSMELEIGENGSFDSVFTAAQSEWDALCGKFEIEGASYHELVTFYSCLYRMYAFPSLYSENTGTNEEPAWVYASPYKSGKATEGILYTNNGFWDTYRTAWAGYALFTEEADSDYLNGLVQHYKDCGWMPRWLGPGAVNCMVGTSSDVIFADAYLKGIDFDYEAAWESMVKNAAVYKSDLTLGGRNWTNVSSYLGYIPCYYADTFIQEAYSSSMEGYINDYGLYKMAEAMGLDDEAEYYRNRCMKYYVLFNEEIGFFEGKTDDGIWSHVKGGTEYDPAHWNGPLYDYTESVGWVNTFSAVFDGNGLSILYGGEEALGDKLDALFDDSIEAMKLVVEGFGHEISEYKEVKMGQYEHNNQPSHHIIYTYAFTDTPYKIQEYTREVLRHVYVGSTIGQGYPGDEDNGEMSAWYIFNALGFYPYSMASGEYVIGSPLYDKVTVHLDNGNDIVIVANNNSDENVYIQSAKVNGEDYNKLYLTHEQLTAGCTIEFEMGSTPSAFGTGEDSKPTSMTTGDTVSAQFDLTSVQTLVNGSFTAGAGEAKVYTAASDAECLVDNNSKTYTTVEEGTTVTYGGTVPTVLSMITLTSNRKAQSVGSFTLEASNDGETWVTLRKEEALTWDYDLYVRPFAVDEDLRGAYCYYRVTLGEGQLAEIEFIGEASDSTVPDELPEVPSDDGSDSDADVDSDAPADPSGDPSAEPDAPKTGDENRTALWIGLSVLSAALAAFTAAFLRWKKKKDAESIL